MIKILVFASVIAFAYSQIPIEANEEILCPPGSLHIKHPFDCRKFFKCANGVAVPFECPLGQHWSESEDWCDWPDRAGCGPAPEIPSDTICPFGSQLSPVHLPHESDCTKFYKCSNGVPVEKTCPKGLHWNVENDWCDWPDQANCNLRYSPERSSNEDSDDSNSSESSSQESDEQA